VGMGCREQVGLVKVQCWPKGDACSGGLVKSLVVGKIRYI
jgi:hypothetical protein